MNPAIAANLYDRRLSARMTDFFALDEQLWPRRLWDVGSLLALEELVEAYSSTRHRMPSAATLDLQRQQLRQAIGSDVGLGHRDLRAGLRSLLSNPLPAAGPAHRHLRALIDRARHGYLDRWAAAARVEGLRPSPERLARMVASHLLDLGHDANHLAAWIGSLAKERASTDQILREAAGLEAVDSREFTVGTTIGPAVTGAWAAIESLLWHPEDPEEEERPGKAVAADRLATIIACSWPRAEMLILAGRHQAENADALAEALSACTTDHARASVIADALAENPADLFRRDSDAAAAQRMRRVLTDSRAELATAVSVLRVAIRRLYRARDIVLHGDSLQGVAVDAVLRVAGPLVDAGLDRIALAALAEGLAPLDLAARAEVGLALVAGETGLSVIDLLESPRRSRTTKPAPPSGMGGAGRAERMGVRSGTTRRSRRG